MNTLTKEEIIEQLPKWFKEKYKIELGDYKTAGKYGIKMEDVFNLLQEYIIEV